MLFDFLINKYESVNWVEMKNSANQKTDFNIFIYLNYFEKLFKTRCQENQSRWPQQSQALQIITDLHCCYFPMPKFDIPLIHYS